MRIVCPVGVMVQSSDQGEVSVPEHILHEKVTFLRTTVVVFYKVGNQPTTTKKRLNFYPVVYHKGTLTFG